MPSVVRFTSPRQSEVVEEPLAPLGQDEVRLRTLYSGISAGTELTAYRGSNPYLTKRWDEESRLFVEGSTSFSYPVDGWGYEEVGEVVELGAEAVGVAVGDRVWGTWRSDEESRRLLVEALVELGAHAAREGSVLFLEPLNRYEDYLVNTLADAVSIVEEVGSPGVAVIADTYHMSIEEVDCAASIEAAGAHIRHVQLGDSNRLEPGAGHYDWPATLAALDRIGFDGWLAMECGLGGPTGDVLPGVATLLRAR